MRDLRIGRLGALRQRRTAEQVTAAIAALNRTNMVLFSRGAGSWASVL
jgi:hypothetical protein